MSTMPYPVKPCSACPWSRETPPGQFSAARYRQLRATTGVNGYGADYGAPLFACHKSQDGKDLPCAGWMASVGDLNPMVRIAIAQGRLPRSVLTPGAEWPPLFDTYEAMEQAQARTEESQAALRDPLTTAENAPYFAADTPRDTSDLPGPGAAPGGRPAAREGMA